MSALEGTGVRGEHVPMSRVDLARYVRGLTATLAPAMAPAVDLRM